MAIVRRVGPGSAFKVGFAVYAFLGLLIGVICAIVLLAGSRLGPGAGLPFSGLTAAIVALVACPILYGVIGGIAGVIGALIYNLAAGWVGGLELDLG